MLRSLAPSAERWRDVLNHRLDLDQMAAATRRGRRSRRRFHPRPAQVLVGKIRLDPDRIIAAIVDRREYW
jgi:hypothetical protein